MSMMKYISVCAIFSMVVFYASCKQNQPDDRGKSETQDTVSSHRSSDPTVHTQYVYPDATGKRIVVQNGYPRGGLRYTDPHGGVYGYVIFWTRIINETSDALTVAMDFPLDSIEVPSSSGRYMRLLLPPDTLTRNKLTVFDYGLNIKSFLDKHLDNPAALRRTINPGDSSAFRVVILAKWKPVAGDSGVLRSGLTVKGQNLFYTISTYTPSRDRPPTLTLANEKEIQCGSINLNLK